VIGAPFYVMELLEGEVVTSQLPPGLSDAAEHPRIAEELIDALVELHAVAPDSLALEGFGRPTGYLERQVRRFLGLWEHNKTRELPEVAEVARWLSDNLPDRSPAPPATIVHGDYRLGNVMYAPRAPARLVAIFDWEMATVGDPLADVGYMISHWRERGDPPTRFNLQTVTEQPGFPTRRELVERYERRSGRSVDGLDWYIALAIWKSVVFMEGNYKRALTGATDDPYLKTFGEGVTELAGRALDVTRHGF
jgi:aminoglycoside phosphotransferase (APT) family kinase protein